MKLKSSLLLGTLLISLAAIAQTTSGLVAWWPLNGNLNDSSGNGFNGSSIASPTYIDDRFSRTQSALSFNGSTQYGRFGDILDTVFCKTTSQFTISCWAKVNAFPATGYRGVLVGKSAGGTGPYQWYLLCDNDQKFTAAAMSSSSGPVNWVEKKSAGVSSNAWYHVVMVFDGSQSTPANRVSIFVNAVAGSGTQTNGTLGPTTTNTAQEITIGAGHANGVPTTPNNQFNGSLDDVRIYNRVLTSTEIAQLTASFPSNYYSKSSGSLNVLSTWGTNPDGSGTAPSSFNQNNTGYNVVNNTSPSISGNWIVTGSNTAIILGDGLGSINFSIPTGTTVGSDSIFVRNNVTLTMASSGGIATNKPGFESGSVVQYSSSSTQTLLPASYSNLVVIGGTKTLSGNTTVRNTLAMLADINGNGNVLTLGTSTSSTGTLTYGSGLFSGSFSRWFAASTNSGSTGLFPVGTAGAYRPIQIEYTSAPASGGVLTVAFVSSAPGNSGLNPALTDFTTAPIVSVNKTGINGYWTVAASQGLSGGTFTSTATASAFYGVSSVSALRLVRRANASSGWSLSGNAGTNSGATSAPMVVRTGLTVLGEFAIAGDSTVNSLPVSFLNLRANLRERNLVTLSWMTAQELNNDRFEIERNQNGYWKNIGTVKGQGNSNSAVSYHFNDNIDVNTGNRSYYRVRQIDFDGASTTSTIVEIDHEADRNVTLYPNPASELVTIDGCTEVKIFNVYGTEVYFGTAGRIDVSTWPSGVYHIDPVGYPKKITKFVVE